MVSVGDLRQDRRAMDTVSIPLSIWDISGRLALATLFGAIVGIDREVQGKPAGLRTNSLVALGGALFTIIGLLLSEGDATATSRILQGITAGLGFIGGGVIMRRPEMQDVQGLTTAAALWLVSAVGVAAGAGLWRTSLVAIGISLLVLVLGDRVDRWLQRS